MNILSTNTIFDTTLSPSTAQKRGFEYVDDIYLDKRRHSSREFLQILEVNEIRLGMPKRNESSFYGLYIPMKESNL